MPAPSSPSRTRSGGRAPRWRRVRAQHGRRRRGSRVGVARARGGPRVVDPCRDECERTADGSVAGADVRDRAHAVLQPGDSALPQALASVILPNREGARDTRSIRSSFRLDQANRLVFGSIGAARSTGRTTPGQYRLPIDRREARPSEPPGPACQDSEMRARPGFSSGNRDGFVTKRCE